MIEHDQQRDDSLEDADSHAESESEPTANKGGFLPFKELLLPIAESDTEEP